MNSIKNKKLIAMALSLTLCLTLAIPFPIFADNGNEQAAEVQNYADNEAIVCYIDPQDVNQTALEEEIIDKAQADNAGVYGVMGDEANAAVDAIVDEQLELADMVKSANSLMDLGDKPIKKMKKINKKVIKAKKVKAGKAKEKLGHIKSKKYSTEELVQKLEQLPNVEYAQPNYYNVPYASTYYDLQWAYNGASTYYGLNVPDWNVKINKNAKGSVVAILDTGVNYSHPDLQNVMWDDGLKIDALKKMGGGQYGYNSDKRSSNPMDTYGHGSHCAGIIGAEWNNEGVSGAANGVEIMAVKAGESGFSDAALIEGMRYIRIAKENGVNVVAVNNSWGPSGPSKSLDKAIYSAIEQLGNKGVMCIFAAGNESSDTDKEYSNLRIDGTRYSGFFQAHFYHSLSNVIIVAAHGPYGEKPDYSNYGKENVDVFAPGGDKKYGEKYKIYSTSLNKSYEYMQGTSMATPAVAGAVAILRSQYPDKTIADIKNAIIESVRKDDKVKDLCTSGGYVDVESALDYLGNRYDATDLEKSDTLIPSDALQSNEALDTEEEIQGALKDAMSDSTFVQTETSVKYMDIQLKSDARILNGDAVITIPFSWIDAELTEESARQSEFVVSHMIDDGDNAGTVEILRPVVTSEGIEVSVSSLSPFAIAYREIVRGDFDESGALSLDDVTALCGALVNKVAFSNYQNQATDLDKNGKLSIADAIMLRNLIADGGDQGE